MKKLLLLLMALPVALCGQVSFDFENGSSSGWVFSNPDRWSVEQLLPISGLWSLHHSYDNSDYGADMAACDISTLRPDLGTVKWRFSVRHGYDPSSSNNWGVFLSSSGDINEMMPGGNCSGYVAGVNMSGYDDTLRIWRVESGSLIEVVGSSVNWQNDVGTSHYALLEITRTPGGIWSISFGLDGAVPEQAGEGSDNHWYSGSLFGICYRYSSTRDMLLWFDDILIDGVFVEDLVAPTVNSSCFISGSSLLLSLDERPAAECLVPENFVVTGEEIFPVSVKYTGDRSIILHFDRFLENKREYNVLVKSLCDIAGNCNQNVNVTVTLAFPEWGDIVISEFMADPDPAVHLPECEYIEIYNRSEFEYNLESIILTVGARESLLPAGRLLPGGYLVLCDDNCDWTGFPEIISVGLPGFPAISNNGTSVFISDTAGNTLHGIVFAADWYNDALKSEGGWSMEMIDTDYPFQSGSNWKFSTSRNGGTPGSPNSVSSFNPDICPPWLDNLFPINDSILKVDFSEPVDITSTLAGEWIFGNKSVKSVVQHDRLRMSYLVEAVESLVDGLVYRLEVPGGVTDFNANRLERSILGTGIPSSPGWNDLVINEILFDALPQESEYIEIFNPTEKVFDAAGLFIAQVNTQSGDTGKPAWLSEVHRCILPGNYFVITDDENSVVANYPVSDHYSVFELSSFPSMADDKGSLHLFSLEHDIVDRVNYSENMHFDLLAVTEGVSLERINALLPSDNTSNWHSASGTSGWGTPGVENSMAADNLFSASHVSLSSRKISPDNDGFEDFLEINVKTGEQGNIITCTIFNESGFPVKQIARNITAGGQNSFIWDATADGGSLLRSGIYIVFIQVTGSRGEVTRFKEVCAVVR